jgi:hypothetical protein
MQYDSGTDSLQVFRTALAEREDIRSKLAQLATKLSDWRNLHLLDELANLNSLSLRVSQVQKLEEARQNQE